MPKRAAIVTRLHSFEIYEWAPKINWNAVDKIILVSKAMQQMFGELYPDHGHKTEVVYNGRLLEAFSPPTNREFNFNLGMLCNIRPIKRVYETILMFYGLRAQGYDARLHIAGESRGDHRYAASVYRLVKDLKLDNYVTFYGYVTDPERWLQQIDIFISNSFWEGHPVALLEAMAAGCYCLSHTWAGAEEMLPEENLYVTEAELQQKIIEYAQMSQDEKENCHTRLRSIALEKFDISQTSTQIRRIIEEVGTKMNPGNGRRA
jgi:glycosyltransferase involved in cell wall biosynthesis